MTNEQIKKILLSGGYVTEKNIQEAEAYSKANKIPIADYLVEKEFISKDILGQAVAEFFSLNYADLNTYMPDSQQIRKIPEEVAKNKNSITGKYLKEKL